MKFSLLAVLATLLPYAAFAMPGNMTALRSGYFVAESRDHTAFSGGCESRMVTVEENHLTLVPIQGGWWNHMSCTFANVSRRLGCKETVPDADAKCSGDEFITVPRQMMSSLVKAEEIEVDRQDGSFLVVEHRYSRVGCKGFYPGYCSFDLYEGRVLTRFVPKN